MRAEWVVPLVDVKVHDELTVGAREALESGWWTMGPRVEGFEHAFAEWSGARHAVALSSGTAALHLALVAVGVGPGDEVVLPSLNFVATANAVLHAGGTPVFCDVGGPEDLNLGPNDLESAVTSRTRAIVVLHYGGLPCDMDAAHTIARTHGIALIEDAAHAPGARWRGRACGTIGAVGCFSFFSNKNLPIGEGGMLITNDDLIADRVRLLRSHGMTTLTWDRHTGHSSSYDVVVPGFNYRLDEARAAIGVLQLNRLEADNARRREIVNRYRERLDGLDGLAWPMQEHEQRVSSHHLAVVVLADGAKRERLRRALGERRIQSSVHYPPIHRFTAYGKIGARRPLPCTENVADRILTLPLFAHMTDDQVEAVVDGVQAALR